MSITLQYCWVSFISSYKLISICLFYLWNVKGIHQVWSLKIHFHCHSGILIKSNTAWPHIWITACVIITDDISLHVCNGVSQCAWYSSSMYPCKICDDENVSSNNLSFDDVSAASCEKIRLWNVIVNCEVNHYSKRFYCGKIQFS